jgi:hypothetical protein
MGPLQTRETPKRPFRLPARAALGVLPGALGGRREAAATAATAPAASTTAPPACRPPPRPSWTPHPSPRQPLPGNECPLLYLTIPEGCKIPKGLLHTNWDVPAAGVADRRVQTPQGGPAGIHGPCFAYGPQNAPAGQPGASPGMSRSPTTSRRPAVSPTPATGCSASCGTWGRPEAPGASRRLSATNWERSWG